MERGSKTNIIMSSSTSSSADENDVSIRRSNTNSSGHSVEQSSKQSPSVHAGTEIRQEPFLADDKSSVKKQSLLQMIRQHSFVKNIS